MGASAMDTGWWLGLRTTKWSAEEILVVQRIYGLLAVSFFLIFIPQVVTLVAIGIDPLRVLFIGMLTSFPLSFIAGRRLCVRLWPDLTKRADENAAKRIGAIAGGIRRVVETKIVAIVTVLFPFIILAGAVVWAHYQ
jgi:hypothetical protein